MVDRYYGSYEALSIQSFETVSSITVSSDSNLQNVQITSEMVQRLHCPEEPESSSHSNSPLQSAFTPQVSEAEDLDMPPSHETLNYDDENDERTKNKRQLMIVYNNGDINCALHFLIKSLVNPSACNAVAKVLVEERLRQEFVQRVVAHMRPLNIDVAESSIFQETLQRLQELNLETIKAKIDFPDVSPILVCDSHYSQLGEEVAGVIFFGTFRSTYDIIDICEKDRRQYSQTSIWNESIEELYQLVVSLNCPVFFFNCSNVTLQPIASSVANSANEACVADGFHYESLQIRDQMKTIVFPIGAHLSQKTNEPHAYIAPISYLNE